MEYDTNACDTYGNGAPLDGSSGDNQLIVDSASGNATTNKQDKRIESVELWRFVF